MYLPAFFSHFFVQCIVHEIFHDSRLVNFTQCIVHEILHDSVPVNFTHTVHCA